MRYSIRTGLFERICLLRWGQLSFAVVFSSILPVSLFLVGNIAGMRINTTPSLPRGLYISAGASSPLVEFCPVGSVASISTDRGYRVNGSCPDGSSALMKPIIAKPGDHVQLTAAGISVNGRFLANTAPLTMDTQHRPLQHFPYGRYTVGKGEVWVASSYNFHSFDSRYYGPVSILLISRHLRPLLTL